MASLLDPIQIGDIHLPNWVIMAPLTRLALCTKGTAAEQGACAACENPCLGPDHPERRSAEGAAGKAPNSKLAIWT
jgi:hypothetical protein